MTSRNQPFAKLEIGLPDSGRYRAFKFSRAQFEIAMILFPAVAIWGVVSTGLLIYQIRLQPTQQRPEQTVQQSDVQTGAQTGAQAEQQMISTSLQKSESPASNVASLNMKSVSANANFVAGGRSASSSSDKILRDKSPKYTAARFMVDDAFAVTARISGAGTKGPYSIALDVENLSVNLQRGHLWARVNAIGENGQDVFLYTSPSIVIGSDGRIQNPRKGVAFSFQRFLQRTIPLYGDNQVVSELRSIEIGFDRRDRGQSVATVALQQSGH